MDNISHRVWRYSGVLALAPFVFPALLGAQPPTTEGTTGDRTMTETTAEPRMRTDAERARTTDRTRTDDRYEYHRPGEFYVAGFGGYTFGHSFNNVQGTGGIEGVPLPSVGLSNTGVYGGKVGYFMPDQLNWLGVEVEAFHNTPHLKQSPMGPGGNLSVTTLAFNLVARGKFGCSVHKDDRGRGTVSGTRTDYEHHYFCPIQPYAGVGLGLFFADLTGGLAGGRDNSDNAVPGFNGLAGIRMFLNEHIAVFGEYKYQRARFDFDNVVAAGTGIRGDYSVSQVVGGLSFHF